MNIRSELERRLSEAMAAAGAPPASAALVAPSGRPQFGDYQANGVMGAAKRLKTNPRELAEKIVETVDLADIAEKLEVAGPGFINITLRDDWLAARLCEHLEDEQLGVEPPAKPETVVVDYSGPNLAKEMHVGHLRSTIIGDAIARTLEFIGHKVVRQNHVGDWGTQFGMLIVYMQRVGADDAKTQLADLEEFYRQAKALFDADEQFADKARRQVVKLQSGDRACRKSWRAYIDESLAHCRRVYERLGVTLTDDDLRPESAYNDDLPKVVTDLDSAGLLTLSKGAQCVFLDEFKGAENEPLPFIVQKSDGGYLYATSDLVAVRYRVNTIGADRVLYVVDSRQSLHFRQLFAVAGAAGFAGESVALEHIGFGTMMGKDNRPFKTRTGGTVKLMDLLDEAEQRAFELVSEKNPGLAEADRRRIAATVGIGAVKYADLSHSRTSDYVFSWDKMLAMDGNTAPYMQYAYARVRSIFRKAGSEAATGEITIQAPAERTLAVKLAQFPEILDAVAADSLPSTLCSYLFELAGAFMSFYENCPVLQSDQPLKSSRLMLCMLTARTIQKGLELLGIETIEQM